LTKWQRCSTIPRMTSGQFLCPPNEFALEYTLISGQAFRWHLDAEGWWSCLLPVSREGCREDVLVRLRRDAHVVHYEGSDKDTFALIQDYFRLEINLQALSQGFAQNDPLLSIAVARFPGLRVMHQEPIENLFSFLCTPAAPLHRIRRGIAGLCRLYGEASLEAGGITHFSFPTLEALAGASVAEMMTLGLGYRARFLQATARRVVENGGTDWLASLREAPYAEAKAALLTLPGVGEKIADCVCLFSLDKDEAIPIDTHIRRIAGRDYGTGLATRSLTPSAYTQIGDTLRARFGPMAGWAQQFLFFHELYGKGAWETYAALYKPSLGETQGL
jgi:N-glycosylase/DNA lyase